MSFDESMAKVGTYLRNNDLSNADNNDRFFYIILNDLRQEYTPTIEMTKKQRVNFLNAKKSGKNFYDLWGHYKMNSNNSLGHYSEFQLMQAWLHPETIKIADE